MSEQSRGIEDRYSLVDSFRTLRESGADALVSEFGQELRGGRRAASPSGAMTPFIERCRLASDRRTIRQLLRETASLFSGDHATLHRIAAPNGCAFLRSLETTYPKPWLLRYTFKNYASIDPVLHATETWKAFFFWDEIDHGEKDTRKFWQDASQHGIGPNGATEVARLSSGWRLALSVASGLESDEFRARLMPKLADFQAVTQAISESFCRINGFPGVQSLSQDDLEYLSFVWDGGERSKFVSSNGQPGSALEGEIARKLACMSFDQALILAGKIGLIEAPDFLLHTVLKET